MIKEPKQSSPTKSSGADVKPDSALTPQSEGALAARADPNTGTPTAPAAGAETEPAGESTADGAAERSGEDSAPASVPPSAAGDDAPAAGAARDALSAATEPADAATSDSPAALSSASAAMTSPAPVINKQPMTADAQYMQQQSHIFVFSTQLANKAFEAVQQERFPTIIAYHCSQPGTRKYLDRNPLKQSQLSRGLGPAPWTGAGRRGARAGAPSGMAAPGPPQGAAPAPPAPGPASAACQMSQQSPCPPQQPPHNTGPFLQASGGIGAGTLSSGAAVPCSVGGASAAGVPSSCASGRPLTSVQCLPDKVLTPEQRHHRAAQLATLKRIGEMLLPDEPAAVGSAAPGAPLHPGSDSGGAGMPLAGSAPGPRFGVAPVPGMPDPGGVRPGANGSCPMAPGPGGPESFGMVPCKNDMQPCQMDGNLVPMGPGSGGMPPIGPNDGGMSPAGGFSGGNMFPGGDGQMMMAPGGQPGMGMIQNGSPMMMGPNGPVRFNMGPSDPMNMGPSGMAMGPGGMRMDPNGPGAMMDPNGMMMGPNGAMMANMPGPGGYPPHMGSGGPMMPQGGPMGAGRMGPVYPGGGMDPRMMAIPQRMMGPGGPPRSLAAQMEWQQLQSQFYDQRRRKGMPPNMGPGNIMVPQGPGSPMGMMGPVGPMGPGRPMGPGGPNTIPMSGGNMMGPGSPNCQMGPGPGAPMGYCGPITPVSSMGTCSPLGPGSPQLRPTGPLTPQGFPAGAGSQSPHMSGGVMGPAGPLPPQQVISGPGSGCVLPQEPCSPLCGPVPGGPGSPLCGPVTSRLQLAGGRLQGPPPPYSQPGLSSPAAAPPAAASPSMHGSPRLGSPSVCPRLPTPPHSAGAAAALPSPRPDQTASASPRQHGSPASVSCAAAAGAPPPVASVPELTPPQSQPPVSSAPSTSPGSQAPTGDSRTPAAGSGGMSCFAGAGPTAEPTLGEGERPRLMPVPSPQQIQYINNFEGQELTIQKQPNNSTSFPSGGPPMSTAGFACAPTVADRLARPPAPVQMSGCPPRLPTAGAAMLPPGAMAGPNAGVAGPGPGGVVGPGMVMPGPGPGMTGPAAGMPMGAMSPGMGGPLRGTGRPGPLGPLAMGGAGPRMASFPDVMPHDQAHVPLNPQQAPPSDGRAFDPISSMVQMSQQLTGADSPGPCTPPAGAGDVPAGVATSRAPLAAQSPKTSRRGGSPGGKVSRSLSAGPYGGASVQVKPSAPNTIQYLPARPQTADAAPRAPPSLDFLQRFTAPQAQMGGMCAPGSPGPMGGPRPMGGPKDMIMGGMMGAGGPMHRMPMAGEMRYAAPMGGMGMVGGSMPGPGGAMSPAYRAGMPLPGGPAALMSGGGAAPGPRMMGVVSDSAMFGMNGSGSPGAGAPMPGMPPGKPPAGMAGSPDVAQPLPPSMAQPGGMRASPYNWYH